MLCLEPFCRSRNGQAPISCEAPYSSPFTLGLQERRGVIGWVRLVPRLQKIPEGVPAGRQAGLPPLAV